MTEPGWGRPPPGDGQPPPYYGPPQNDGKAVSALVLSILSWVLCPVVPAIVALVLAGQSSRQIRESGGRLGGDGMNSAAKIISWINIVVVGGSIVVFFALGTIWSTEFREVGGTTDPYPTFESFDQ